MAGKEVVHAYSWEHERFDFDRYDTCWIGYIGYNRNKLTVTYNGIWLGYRDGELLADMRFKTREPKPTRISRQVYASVLGVHALLSSMHAVMGNALVLVQSKRALKWLHRSTYRLTDLDIKSTLFPLMQIVHPTIESYNPMTFPYSALLEVAQTETDYHHYRMGSYESWIDLAEPDTVS